MAEDAPPPYDDEGSQLPLEKSSWTELQVSEAVRAMGPSAVWVEYSTICTKCNLDGRTMCEATIEDLVELQFQKIHARAVIKYFQSSSSSSVAYISSASSSPESRGIVDPEFKKKECPTKVRMHVAEQVREEPEVFSRGAHIYSPQPSEENIEEAKRLKAEISKTAVYQNDPFAAQFCDDETIHRFLRARQYDYPKALAMLQETLQWRASYRPQDIRGSMLPNTGRTGKVFSHPIRDRWGRPILVLNNTKENCKDWEENVRWLTFQLERARKAMEIDHRRTGARLVEKWVVFIHLTEFSFWNNPPWKVTSETLKLFTSRYPEHLGHAILFEAPPIFSGLFSLCTPFLDEVTKNKVVWISKGDCGEGEKNDLVMKNLIGPDWKTITGAFQPAVNKDTSPGFYFDKFWEGLLREEDQWWQLHRNYANQMKFSFPIPEEEKKEATPPPQQAEQANEEEDEDAVAAAIAAVFSLDDPAPSSCASSSSSSSSSASSASSFASSPSASSSSSSSSEGSSASSSSASSFSSSSSSASSSSSSSASSSSASSSAGFSASSSSSASSSGASSSSSSASSSS